MSSQTQRPASRIGAPTKSSLLRAQANARKVGSEATKPRPGPTPKVTPPTYAAQDQERGAVDQGNTLEEEIAENEEDEIAEQDMPHVQSVAAPAHMGPSRPAFSKRRDAKVISAPQQTAFDAAPFMATFDLVADYKPVQGTPTKTTLYCPAFYRLMNAHASFTSLLTPVQAIYRDDPTYNTVFSRTALAYAGLWQILEARDKCQLNDYEESKALKQLNLAYDWKSVMIPGPYVVFLRSFGFHIPRDKRFDVIAPSFPPLNNELDEAVRYNANQLLLPNFPALVELCRLVAEGYTMVETKKGGSGSDKDDTRLDFWTGRFFVPFHNEDWPVSYPRYFNVSSMSAAGRTQPALFYNSALIYPFYDQQKYLKEVSVSANIAPLPNKTHVTKFKSLLEYLMLDGNKRWMSGLVEALEYESKFAKGSVKLGDIGHEQGQELLCSTQFECETSGHVVDAWHPSFSVKEEGLQSSTNMEGVEDEALQLALLAAPIIRIKGADDITPLKNFNGWTNSATGTSVYSADQYKKAIRNAHPIGNRFRTSFKTTMLIPPGTVLGN